jgi:hypothetical protein
MPNDVKAYVSATVAIVAIVLAYWSGSPVRPEYGPFLLGTASFHDRGDVDFSRGWRKTTPVARLSSWR